jgi:hypothetical protein
MARLMAAGEKPWPSGKAELAAAQTQKELAQKEKQMEKDVRSLANLVAQLLVDLLRVQGRLNEEAA